MIHNDQTYSLGQNGGATQNTISENQLPSHSHGVGSLAASHTLKGTVLANEEDGEANDPRIRNFGITEASTGDVNSYNSETNTTSMAADNVGITGTISLSGNTANTGSTTPVNNMQPYLVVNTIIALEGIDPLAS
jgi:microcystin-dependent protein